MGLYNIIAEQIKSAKPSVSVVDVISESDEITYDSIGVDLDAMEHEVETFHQLHDD